MSDTPPTPVVVADDLEKQIVAEHLEIRAELLEIRSEVTSVSSLVAKEEAKLERLAAALAKQNDEMAALRVEVRELQSQMGEETRLRQSMQRRLESVEAAAAARESVLHALEVRRMAVELTDMVAGQLGLVLPPMQRDIRSWSDLRKYVKYHEDLKERFHALLKDMGITKSVEWAIMTLSPDGCDIALPRVDSSIEELKRLVAGTKYESDKCAVVDIWARLRGM